MQPFVHLTSEYIRTDFNELQARGVALPGATPFPTRASLKNRFMEHAFTMAKAVTLRDIRREYIKPEELDR